MLFEIYYLPCEHQQKYSKGFRLSQVNILVCFAYSRSLHLKDIIQIIYLLATSLLNIRGCSNRLVIRRDSRIFKMSRSPHLHLLDCRRVSLRNVSPCHHLTCFNLTASILAREFLPLTPEQYLFVRTATANGYNPHEVAVKLIETFGSVFVGKPFRMVISTIEKFLSLDGEQVIQYSWSKKIKPKESTISTPSTRPTAPNAMAATHLPSLIAASHLGQSVVTTGVAKRRAQAPAVQEARRPQPQVRSQQARPQGQNPVGVFANLTNLQQTPSPAPSQAPAPAPTLVPALAKRPPPLTESRAINIFSSALPTDPGDFITYALQEKFSISTIADALKVGYPLLLGQLSKADIETAVKAQMESMDRDMEL